MELSRTINSYVKIVESCLNIPYYPSLKYQRRTCDSSGVPGLRLSMGDDNGLPSGDPCARLPHLIKIFLGQTKECE